MKLERLHLRGFLILALALVPGFAEVFGAESLGRTVREQPRQSAGKPTSARRAPLPDLKQQTRQLFGSRTVLRSNAAAFPTGDGFALKQRVGKDVEVIYRPGVGTPMEIDGSVLEPALVASGPGSTDAGIETSRSFLRANRGLLRLDDPDQELVLERRESDGLGRSHLRFTQRHSGRVVWPSELIIHLDPAGNVDLLNGSFVPTPRRIPSRAVVDAPRAVTYAKESMALDVSAKSTAPELIIYAPLDRQPRLAWKFDLFLDLTQRWCVVIDASNGKKLTSFSRVHTANVQGSGIDIGGTRRALNVFQASGTHYMIDTSKPMYKAGSQPPDPNKTEGAIFIIDARNQPPTDDVKSLPDLFNVTSPDPNNWSPRDAVSAAFFLSVTYDYYFAVHNRNSIDGAGGSIVGAVRLGRNFSNAFWIDEQQMMGFGDGDTFAGSLDVISHEVTHGVTNRSSGLIYQDQSGALNEAFSDIMGEMTEAKFSGTNDWLFGSGLAKPDRSLATPEQFQQPSRMSNFVVTKEDDGGVHINSGIINHAYYRLVTSTGGISRNDAERIFFRAFTVHLVKNSQFIDARLATIRAAEELFGAGSNQARQTAEAFDAVEIFSATATPAPRVFSPVPSSDAVLFLRRDGSGRDFLFRRDPARGDAAEGIEILSEPIPEQRVSVTGDGSIAAVIDSTRDVCLLLTDASDSACFDLPGAGLRASSVAISPDAEVLTIILRKSDGTPDGEIAIIDNPLSTSPSIRRLALETPAYDGRDGTDTILFADAMDFTSDSRFIVYDALAEIRLGDGSPVAVWCIYAYDLLDEQFLQVVPPDPDFDIEFPSISQTSDNLVTFEIVETASGRTTVVATNVVTGDFRAIFQFAGDPFAIPSYTGDDSSIVFAAPASTQSGSSLFINALAADQLTPVGPPALWLANAKFGVVYRSGAYSGPSVKPGRFQFSSGTYRADEGKIVTITVRREDGNNGAVSVSYTTSSGTATPSVDFVATSGSLSWPDGDMEDRTFKVQILGDATPEGAESFGIVLQSPVGGATLGTPVQSSVVIDDQVTTTPKPPARRRGSRRG